jgi:hypothetical protein
VTEEARSQRFTRRVLRISRRLPAALSVLAGAWAALASPALGTGGDAACGQGCEHLHFAAGPFTVTPGANLILLDTNKVPKPTVNGFMIRVAPNLHYALPDGKCCGAIPRVDIIHLHHGVWVTNGLAGEGEGNSYHGGFYPFMGVGEEKTVYQVPGGYGYPIGANDAWFLNYMIHNLRETPARVYITYDMDFIPDSSPAARGITPVHPIWMDVEDHHLYGVFDVHRYSGVDGKYTFPDMARNPYRGWPSPLNLFTIDHAGTLVATAGHVHPGGLYTDLDLINRGAHIAGHVRHGSVAHSVRLFQSNAHYFHKRGPISWDMAMTATAADWHPHVNAGDVLRVSATYETRLASWYESMGIMVVWEAYDSEVGLDPFTGKVERPIARQAGVNAFVHQVDQRGHLTHGHLAENNHPGGTPWLTVNPSKLPRCRTRTVVIAGFLYDPGDLDHPTCVPTITQGSSLTFRNADAVVPPPGTNILSSVNTPSAAADLLDPSPAYIDSIFHTITACQSPCGLDTGISYPLANGPGGYDSGQLGFGAPAVGRVSWSTPTTLKPGTYTFFCRIHPFMRGVFRVIQ